MNFSFAVQTTIKGEKMTLLDKGESVQFSDGVQLDRGTDRLIAARMVTNKAREKIKAFGNVKLFRKLDNGEEWRGFGAEGFYDTKTGVGFLLGKAKQAHIVYVQVLSSTATRQIDIFAEKFDFFKINDMGIASGRVYGKTVDPETGDLYEFWAEKAVYEREKGTIVLTGEPQPLVTQKIGKETKKVQGDVVTYSLNEKKFISEGRSRAVFMGDPDKRK